MKMIKPISITDTMLTSSTVAENDYAAWSAATAYTTGQKVIRTSTHRIYQRLTNGTTATAPESDATNWLDIGPTNRWAMFDNVVGTVTSGASPLTVVLRPGSTTGLALLELVGRQAQITMKDAPGGTTVYSKTVSLDGTIIGSFYDWFFSDFEQRTDVTLTDLPGQYTDPELTISITTTSGSPKVGVCKPGQMVDIGRTQAGAKAGIIDFSRKERDTFGNTVVTERAYSKRVSFEVVTDPAAFNRIFRRLAEVRATPTVYIGTDASGFEPLIVYGFFRDFSIDVAYTSHHLCSLEIEGLI